MATNIKGPAIFLAQFAGDAAPFNSWDSITKWAASLGYKGVQIPSWDGRLFDLKKAAKSKTYCDEIKGVAKENGVEVTELSTHLQGQLVAVNPAYDEAFDAFAPPEVHGKPKQRQAWATEQVKLAAKASRNMGLHAGVSFTGVAVLYELDMHYVGQTHTVAVPLPCTLDEGAATTGVNEAMIRKAFEETYRASFSQLLPGIPVRIVSLRTAAVDVRAP